MNIFVTGSAGFIGRSLCAQLRGMKFSVTGCDPKVSQSSAWVFSSSGAPQADIQRTWQSYAAAHPRGVGDDIIIHLAAHIESVDKRMAGGLDAYQDIVQDFEFLKWVECAQPGRVVLMSSCAVDASDDPYGFCKVALEKFAAKLTVPHVILRPFSGYSHTQSLSYPFPALWKQVAERRDPVTVWGDLATVRDWVHAEDLVRAILWAATEAPTDGGPFEIGTGVGTSFLDLVHMMASAVGYSPRIVADTSKPTSTRVRIADTRHAAKYGFSTQISLEEGIRRRVGEGATA